MAERADCCGSCRFFDKIDKRFYDEIGSGKVPRDRERSPHGLCRRFPKTEEVLSAEWCGEWDAAGSRV